MVVVVVAAAAAAAIVAAVVARSTRRQQGKLFGLCGHGLPPACALVPGAVLQVVGYEKESELNAYALRPADHHINVGSVLICRFSLMI